MPVLRTESKKELYSSMESAPKVRIISFYPIGVNPQATIGIEIMADKDQDQPEDNKNKKSGKLMLIIVGAVALISGTLTPIVIAQFTGTSPKEDSTANAKNSNALDIPEANEKIALLDFKEVTVNLNESSFNRYLKVSLSLQIAESQKVEIEKLLAEREAVLRNWLYGHLSDKRLDDIKGKQGHNRLRREIRDEFNKALFDDGVDRIQDVLFREIAVQ